MCYVVTDHYGTSDFVNLIIGTGHIFKVIKNKKEHRSAPFFHKKPLLIKVFCSRIWSTPGEYYLHRQ
jgi:hypothetical protein